MHKASRKLTRHDEEEEYEAIKARYESGHNETQSPIGFDVQSGKVGAQHVASVQTKFD